MQGLGDRIRRFREERGMSQADLARAAGVSRAYLSELESGGGRRPGADLLLRIADALGVTIADLLGRSVRPADPVEVPESLRQFAQEEGLSPEEVRMLASIRLRGGTPRTARRWRFIYQAIVGSAALDETE